MFAAILLPIIAIVAWFSKTKKNDFKLLNENDRDTWESPPSSVETEIRLKNNFKNPIKLVRMNDQGEPDHEEQIESGGSLKVPTYVGHVWRIESQEVLHYFEAVPMPNEGLVLPVETFCDKLKTR